MITHTDSIAALATPAGRGAIGVIRVSGDDAETVAARVCAGLENARGRSVTRVRLVDDTGAAFDDALACVMRAPHSYTGQTVVEIYAHGSPAILRHALEQLYKSGARPAAAGEFTRRAVLNGKLDLLQAEAVCDLIESNAPASARNALGHLKGSVSRQINEVWKIVTSTMAHVAAEVDYPEDDIPEILSSDIMQKLEKASSILQKLIDSYERGRYIKDGVSVAIAGPPNAGKSSLFNALLGYDRAIVTEIAGTTRDSLEESIIIGGLRVVLHDTAGLRETNDVIESEGIRRSKEIIENSVLTLYVVDGSVEAAEIPETDNMLLVVNKSDLPHREYADAVYVSALTGQGLDELFKKIETLADIPSSDETFVTNARHAHAMRQALTGITEAQQALSTDIPADIALGELDIALNALGELTGKTVNEAVLEQVFSKFCVGK